MGARFGSDRGVCESASVSCACCRQVVWDWVVVAPFHQYDDAHLCLECCADIHAAAEECHEALQARAKTGDAVTPDGFEPIKMDGEGDVERWRLLSADAVGEMKYVGAPTDCDHRWLIQRSTMQVKCANCDIRTTAYTVGAATGAPLESAPQFTPKQLALICELSSSALYMDIGLTSAEEQKPLEDLHGCALDRLAVAAIDDTIRTVDSFREGLADILRLLKEAD